MKRIIALFSTLAIFFWILPLGAFIKPSQEKTACGGNRAFHMCTMGMSSAKKVPAPERVTFTSASGAEKDHQSAGGSGGNDFLVISAFAMKPDRCSKLLDFNFCLPIQSFVFLPDPVPKP